LLERCQLIQVDRTRRVGVHPALQCYMQLIGFTLDHLNIMLLNCLLLALSVATTFEFSVEVLGLFE
jgi:hypothetical protein